MDAQNWPGTITLTESYNLNKTNDDGSRYTKTGSATHTYNRAMITSLIARPHSNCSDPIGYSEVANILTNAPKGSFIAYRCAIGKMPGWKFYTKSPDPVTKAFTITYYPPPKDANGNPVDNPPEISYEDSSPNLGLYCAIQAPGRTIAPETDTSNIGLNTYAIPYSPSGQNRFLGINYGYGMDYGAGPQDPAANYHTVYDADYSVTLLQAQMPAANGRDAVGPVYRVSVPEEIYLYEAFSIVKNGQIESFGLEPTPRGVRGLLQAMIGGFQRSPFVVDVLCPYGSTLSAGKVSYVKFGANGAGNSSYYQIGSIAPKILSDPLSIMGRTLSADNSLLGYHVEAQF